MSGDSRLNSNVMKFSRRKNKDLKKPKDNILLGYMGEREGVTTTGPSREQRLHVHEEDIAEAIHEYSPQPDIFTLSNQRDSPEHEESQTILSKFEDSNQNAFELSYSREPSSLTSLQEARKRAK